MKAVKDRHRKFKPSVPIAARHVWEYFQQLDRVRQSTGYGFNPISHQEIEAWAKLYRINLHPWEVDAIASMDTAKLNLLHEDLDKDSEKDPAKPKDVVSERPMSPDLFDALF